MSYLIMRTILTIFVLAMSLAAVPAPSLADWGFGRITNAQAKALGIAVSSEPNSGTLLLVQLQIKTEGDMQVFSREDSGSRIELRIRRGETTLISAPLKEDRTKPGYVVVKFSAERAELDSITLRVWVRGGRSGRGGVIHELP